MLSGPATAAFLPPWDNFLVAPSPFPWCLRPCPAFPPNLATNAILCLMQYHNQVGRGRLVWVPEARVKRAHPGRLGEGQADLPLNPGAHRCATGWGDAVGTREAGSANQSPLGWRGEPKSHRFRVTRWWLLVKVRIFSRSVPRSQSWNTSSF